MSEAPDAGSIVKSSRPDNQLLKDWLRMPGWKPREAAALIAGMSPTRINKQRDIGEEILQSYRSNRRYFERLVEMGKAKEIAKPTYWLSLAKSNGISINDELSEMATQTKAIADYYKLYRKLKGRKKIADEIDDAPNIKRKRSYLTIISTLLEMKHKDWANKKLATSLLSEVHRAGMDMTQKTVKSILDEAAEFQREESTS